MTDTIAGGQAPYNLDMSDHWDHFCLQQLAALDPDWWSEDEAAWALFNTAQILRGRTRKVLVALAEAGVLEAIPFRHRGTVSRIYRLDPVAITAFVEQQS